MDNLYLAYGNYRQTREEFDDELIKAFSKPIIGLAGIKGKMFQGMATKKQTEKQVGRWLKESKDNTYDKPSHDAVDYEDPVLDQLRKQDVNKEWSPRRIGFRTNLGSMAIAHFLSYYLGYETLYIDDVIHMSLWHDGQIGAVNALCRYFGLSEMYERKYFDNPEYNKLEIEDFGIWVGRIDIAAVTPGMIFKAYKDFPLPYVYKKITDMKLEKERHTKRIGMSQNGCIDMEDDSIIDMTEESVKKARKKIRLLDMKL